jgi:hypothetical protein
MTPSTPMRRTRLSLYYLAGYLTLGGFALLLIPSQTLHFLLASGHYGQIFPRFTGMLMSGLGLNIAGIIRARAQVLYPATLFVRSFFIICLIVFYWLSSDPLFLVVLGVVLLGVGLTLTSYLLDRASAS